MTVAPWWWFPCRPKHVGAVLLILKCFNNSTFFNVVCVSWKLKCWILLMHGVTMKLEFIGIHPFLAAGMHLIWVVDSRLLCVVQGISYMWLCSLPRTKVIFHSTCKSLMINWAELSSVKASLSWYSSSELKTRSQNLWARKLIIFNLHAYLCPRYIF